MKTVEIYDNLPIPSYALSYLVNGDNSGLENDQQTTIDNYMTQFYQTAQENSGSVIINTEDGNEYFSWYPEFGEDGCMVENCTIAIMADDNAGEDTSATIETNGSKQDGKI